MKFSIKKLVYGIVVFMLFCNITAIAQPDFPGGPDIPYEPDEDPDNAVPIDGGAGVLIAAGVAYGLKKIYDKRKKEDETKDLS